MTRLNDLVVETWAKMSEGKVDHAFESAKKAVVIDGDHPDALEALGLVLNARGEYDLAIQYLKKATDISDDIGLRLSLARVYQENSENLKAMQLYQKVITEEPNNIRSLYNMGDILKERGAYYSAMHYFNKVIQLDVITKVTDGWTRSLPRNRELDLANRKMDYHYKNASYHGLVWTLIEVDRFRDAMKNLFEWKYFQIKSFFSELLEKAKP